MRAAGRSVWTRDDYNTAVETFNRLWPEPTDDGPKEDPR